MYKLIVGFSFIITCSNTQLLTASESYYTYKY